MVRTAQPCHQFHEWWVSKVVLVLNDVQAAPPHILGFSPSRSEGENPGAEPVPLFSATLRENQGHETDRSAAA